MQDKRRASDIKQIFRALRYRNFRLFFLGQGVSLLGTWMQSVAMGWLVYRMTGSAFLLGLVGFSSQIPSFLLGPLAGVVADRTSRHKIILVTQTLAMIQALLLAYLTITGTITVAHLISLGLFLGCISSFDIPARQAFVLEMVERKDNLPNAIALNSLMFNSARLIGPSVAGAIIAIFGEGVCFLVNGVSFLAVIISLLVMKVAPRPSVSGKINMIARMKEGFRYAFGIVPIRMILVLLSVINLMGVSYVVLMPVFARDVLGGGAETLGFLMAAVGLGALVATVFLAMRKSVLGLGRMIPVASALFAAGMIAFSFSKALWLSLLLLGLMGFGFMVSAASCNIILQTISDDDKRGRVMSFYVMAFMGMAPIGSLLAGTLASHIGAPGALAISGLSCLVASAVFAGNLSVMRAAIHPIYRKMGIIPEVATGINTVSELSVPPED